MRGLSTLALGVSMSVAGVSCSLDWGRLDPRTDVPAQDAVPIADADQSSDAAPCGAEDQRCCPNLSCNSGLVCEGARCRACDRDETACAGRCVTLSDDENNCGLCGVLCIAGERCVQGRCR
jgi:hypothetical protein